ncbi:MAG TPA: peptidoglycan bridge formation glycyltransferase FemA/FemB family protein [Anaerolineae bacterium]|nr:peptidoglycan bridge formation glycyltransferase FemA/FemB family protein [Anaerolineae bacterium]
MERVEVRDAEAWDAALLALPNPHVLQSWAWGEFKTQHGWQATRLLFVEGGEAVAAASVLERRVGRLPTPVLYVPKGPALDWDECGVRVQVAAELEALARQRRALFVKIDPDVYYPAGMQASGPAQGAGPAPTGPGTNGAGDGPACGGRPECAEALAEVLTARGWRFSGEQVQYRNTVLLDLSQSEEELLAGMKQKSRYNVRLARRRGVTVREGVAGDLALFYGLYAETAERDHFIIRPAEYYVDVWGRFLERGAAQLLLAEVAGETVAGLMLFTFGPTAWYMYGASSDQHREDMPNHLLQWEACRTAKAAGCRLYDLWGAPDRLEEADPMWGVHQFKVGLGGKAAQGVGAWDYPSCRLGYRLYTDVMPRILGRMQRRAGNEGA